MEKNISDMKENSVKRAWKSVKDVHPRTGTRVNDEKKEGLSGVVQAV